MHCYLKEMTDPGVYHELILFGSDLDWLWGMHVSVEDLNG
jgi:hypothetical protein